MMRSLLLRRCCFCGAEGGPLLYKFVPTAIEGAPSPAGAQRACERSRPRSGLDGERGRGDELVQERPLPLPHRNSSGAVGGSASLDLQDTRT
jgi:hypothetical protein